MILKNIYPLLLLLISNSLLAQKLPLSFMPEFAVPIQYFNKEILTAKPISLGQQYGVSLKKGLGKHFAIGLEGQYNAYTLKDNIEKTYALYLNNTAQRNYNPTKVWNGLLNLEYYQ